MLFIVVPFFSFLSILSTGTTGSIPFFRYSDMNSSSLVVYVRPLVLSAIFKLSLTYSAGIDSVVVKTFNTSLALSSFTIVIINSFLTSVILLNISSILSIPSFATSSDKTILLKWYHIISRSLKLYF